MNKDAKFILCQNIDTRVNHYIETDFLSRNEKQWLVVEPEELTVDELAAKSRPSKPKPTKAKPKPAKVETKE